jgi:hypothetical protein
MVFMVRLGCTPWRRSMLVRRIAMTIAGQRLALIHIIVEPR